MFGLQKCLYKGTERTCYMIHTTSNSRKIELKAWDARKHAFTYTRVHRHVLVRCEIRNQRSYQDNHRKVKDYAVRLVNQTCNHM